ncbi:MAG: YkgJ family cysteine cluster protein [Desulfuromonadaceae bacterium]|nr:YkgJ family cysteine cluster protein [Desulfuromonadaceae bacterium]MDD5105791.1 YkgJ family cysteine cluster protein [Desulfuromonadaceae bacterium]
MRDLIGFLIDVFEPEKQIKHKGCLCCGRCCASFGGHLRATRHDLDRWDNEGRDDLLSRVNRLNWIWVDPQSKEPLDMCPFIEKINEQQAVCAIQNTKPEMCRDYPTMAHGHRCLSGTFLKI